MAGDVFISHASEDANAAAEVCALLEARGVRCWIAPRDVAAGGVWDEAILDAIEQSRAFLLILSKSANDSQFVKNEVNRAFSQSKPIVTFRLEDVVPGRSLELYLARHHWTDGFGGPLSTRVEGLAGSLTALLGAAGTPNTTIPPATPAAPPALSSGLASARRVVANGVGTVKRHSLAFGMTVLLSAGISALAIWNLRPSLAPNQTVTRFTITLPPGQSIAASFQAGVSLALSSDGTKLAYVATEKGTRRIYLRAMDGVEAKPILGTEGGSDPFFSPDGKWLGFFAAGRLKKIPVDGGPALTLADGYAQDLGGDWSSGGIALGALGGIQRVADGGGTPQVLTHPAEGQSADLSPEWLSDRALLFAGAGATTQVVAQSTPSGERRSLVAGATPRYARSGHLLFVQAGTLMAARFDVQHLQITGAAVPVVQGILQNPATGIAEYSISQSGSLAYVSGPEAIQCGMVWVNRNGTEQAIPAPLHYYQDPRVSPDGRTIAISTVDEGRHYQVQLFDIDRGTLSPLTFQGVNRVPVWTRDGMHIAYLQEAPEEGLFWQRADGTGGPDRLMTDRYIVIPTSFSPDSQLLAFVELNPRTQDDIWTLRLGDRKSQPFLLTPANETAPAFSPDGHWLAYVSEESGQRQVYVQPYPGPGGKWQISTEGGTEPVWNRNGRELFYRNGDQMMAVDIDTRSGFGAGKPRQLFEGDYVLNYFPNPYYDVSPDGQRFLMLKPVRQEQSANQINVVLNWFEELKQKVPTGNK